ELIALGREAVILKTQRNVGRRARPDRDRGIVGHQVKALDIGLVLVGGDRRRRQQSGNEKRNGGESERSHDNTPANVEQSRRCAWALAPVASEPRHHRLTSGKIRRASYK